MLEEVKWGEFRIGDLFDVDSWVYGKNKKYYTNLTEPTDSSIPVISGITENNGVNYYTEDRLSKEEVFEKELTITTRGVYSGTVFYHDEKFALANNILVMKMPNLTKNIKMFFGAIINSLDYGGYSGYPRKATLKEDRIQLPILEDGSINFSFMEKFIAELEATHLAELEAYLSVTGLKDYELTQEEKQALEDFENKEWVNLKIEELFKVNSYKKRFDANKVTILEKGEYPYIVRTAFNNGVRGYLKEDTDYLNDENTISFGQDTATMFYQKTPYFTGDKIKILKHKDKNFNEEKALFLITSMRKSFKSFTWGAKSYSEKVIKSQKIKVPQNDKEIDYEFMEIFISAIKKLVIKDVVEFSNKKIETTKEIINK